MVVEIAGRTVIFLICDFMCNSSGNFSPRALLPKRRALTWATAYNIISYHKINFKIQLLWRHVTTSRILLWRYFMTTLSKSRDFHQAVWGYYLMLIAMDACSKSLSVIDWRTPMGVLEISFPVLWWFKSFAKFKFRRSTEKCILGSNFKSLFQIGNG